MELSSAVAMIFISQLATGNVDELVIPMVMSGISKIMGGNDDATLMSDAEEQFGNNECVDVVHRLLLISFMHFK